MINTDKQRPSIRSNFPPINLIMSRACKRPGSLLDVSTATLRARVIANLCVSRLFARQQRAVRERVAPRRIA